MQSSDSDFYKRLVDRTREFVGVCDLNLKPLYVNPAGLQMVGLASLADAQQRDVRDWFFPEDRAFIAGPFFQEAMERGVNNTAVRFRHFQTGRPIWVRYHVFTLKNSAGVVEAIGTVSTDISQIKRSEEKYRGIFDNASVGIAECSTDGRFRRVNDHMCEITGYAREELLQKTIADITHQRDRERDLVALAQMQNDDHDEYRVEKRYLHKNGDVIWVQVSVSPLHDDDGAVSSYLGIIREITSRKRAERLVRESETQFHQLADSIPQLAWMTKPNGEVFWFNKRWYDFTGTKLSEMEGWGWQAVIHPDVLPAVLAGWRSSLASGEPFEMTIPLKGKDGSYRPFLTRGQPLRNETGKIVRWFGTNTDIYHRQQLEEQLRQTAAELTTLNQHKDQFLAALGHELRNPLAPIRTGIDLIRKSTDIHRTHEIADVMQRQVRHMVRLVDDLLDIARVTRGKLTLRQFNIDLTHCINEAIVATKLFIDQAQCSLTFDPPSCDVVVFGDADRLLQVFSNLLHNAAKSTPPGGRIAIDISLSEDEKDVVVSIRDTGIGLRKEQLVEIFNLFSQVQRTDGVQGGGLGVGLSMVKAIIEMHGGSVAATSAGRGAGATFTIRLPHVADTAIDVRPADRNPAREPTTKDRLRVLVVDDNMTAADLLTDAISEIGYDVATVYNGRDAVVHARHERPDIILMDIGMPVMDGHEAARAIRAEPWGGTIRLIALTGFGQQSDRDKSIAAGFDDHIIKPVDIDDIEALLDAESAKRNRSNSAAD